jgi:hypothetical protein
MADLCELNWLGVGTAYASVSGLRTLLSTIQNVASSQWVIGLDDYLTHPSVVDVISTLPGAEIRVAGELVSGVRFHPKVYAAVGRGGRNSWLIGGSANMTTSGLSENSEVAIALRATRREDIQTIRDSWPSIWKLGEPPSQSLMRDYRESFAARAAKKPPLQRPLGGVLVDDDATIDPSVANTIWIEVGMKLHFEPNLDYQLQAIEAVCDLFRGQEICRTEFTVTMKLPEADQQLTLGVADRPTWASATA